MLSSIGGGVMAHFGEYLWTPTWVVVFSKILILSQINTHSYLFFLLAQTSYVRFEPVGDHLDIVYFFPRTKERSRKRFIRIMLWTFFETKKGATFFYEPFSIFVGPNTILPCIDPFLCGITLSYLFHDKSTRATRKVGTVATVEPTTSC
jgi:hypothetical protein